MLPQMRSSRPVSCDTMTQVTFLSDSRYSSTHLTFITSRWLVGSSISRMSASRHMARANASFMRHPPERKVTSVCEPFCISPKPTEISMRSTSSSVMPAFWMRGSAKMYSMHGRWDCSPIMSASTNTVRNSLAGGKPSTCSLAMERISVVFPLSFPPSNPYLCPRFSRSRVLWSRTLDPYARVNLQSHNCSASSSSSSSGASVKYIRDMAACSALAARSETP
mmetsp:Transcript_9620/g.15453  ORF Transcript_9620/g.15453 Transcript_9620/m.15453 type:complete len:222 (-) Transcript_9620:1224-1889(-)